MMTNKKFTFAAVIIAVILALSSLSLSNADDLFGDLNGDGSVNSKDLSLLQKVILGSYEPDATPTAELTATPTPLPTAVTRPMDAAFLKNTTELVDFLETVDMKYHPYMDFIRFTTVLSSDGYIIEPLYDSMTISDFSAVRCPLTAYSNHIQPNDLPRYEFIFNNTSKSDTPIKVYVLMNRLNDGSDQAKAHAYLTGASTELSTDYFKGYTETTADINGIETSVLYREKTENTTERAVFAHDKYLVYVTASEGIDVFEFMSKLTFEKHTVVRDLTGPHGGYPSTEKPAYIGAQTGAAFSASSEFAEFIETVDISQNYDNKFRCFDSFVNQITDMGYFMDVCYTNNSEYDLKISAFTGVDINDIPANDEPCYEYCLLDSASMLLRTYPQITFSFIDESHAMYEYLTGSTTQLPASLDGYESAVLKIDGVDCPALSLTKDQLNWDHRYYYFMQGDYLVCVDQTAKNLNFADIDETVSNLTFNKVEIKRTLEK